MCCRNDREPKRREARIPIARHEVPGTKEQQFASPGRDDTSYTRQAEHIIGSPDDSSARPPYHGTASVVPISLQHNAALAAVNKLETRNSPVYRSFVDIPSLLEPYVTNLTANQLAQVSTYLDLLLRWNAKMNLTAIRDPQQIVSRHFGESFFLATHLFGPQGVFQLPTYQLTNLLICDLGSGAGFPAIPLKIYHLDVTIKLVEANHRKAVFLREVLRALSLDAEVKNVRAEDLPSASADLVTLRAVEKFDSILPIAARLVRPAKDGPCARSRPRLRDVESGGDCSRSTVHGLSLLIGSAQIARAHEILPNWRFHPEIPIPKSQNRVIQLVEPN